MAKQLMPRPEWERRDSDVELSDEQFARLSLFAQLKRKPSLDKFPGSLILRHYQKGDVICRQGEAGWTAFYILTTDDVLGLREAQLQALPADAGEGERKALRYDVEVLKQRAERLKEAPADDELRTAATVYLAVARDKPKPPSGLGRLFNFGRKADRPTRGPDDKALYIPIDAPVAVDYDTLRAPLEEGELFGEMSCLYRTPRSATIVARRDLYVVEMLRNILDQIQKDPAYKARADELYKKRVLDLHLRKLSIFSDLNDDEFGPVRQGVELVSVAPGTLICDENDRSDSFYVIRSGLVKVVKGATALVSPDDVTDWNALCAGLRAGEAQPAAPAGKLWQLLPERVRAIISGAAAGDALNGPDRAEVVYALNDVIKSPQLADAKEFQPVIAAAPLREQAAELLAERARLKAKKADWPAEEGRRFGRLLLQALLPGALRPLPKQGGPEVVLSYRSRGDFFGEMGLMLQQPRSATCVAFGQPNDMGQVELVRVPGEVFARLMAASPAARAKVEQEVAKRQQHTAKRMATPAWDDSREAQFSGQFLELGLIQGQRLMLIDLDRCTRCDECVKACVNTHDDGRTRLFLDGPRFGKYLVPTTCRSCLDPVCMIGCPVGSIHRGDNGQILIEDWCIGCGLCADNCPYGSIQMHDLGILAEHDREWRFLPAAQVKGEKWQRPGFRDGAWLTGASPFRLDRDLKERLGAAGPVNFRREFSLTKEQVRGEAQFKLEVVSLAPELKVWLNGQELTADGKPKRDGRREYTLPQKRVANGAATEALIRPQAGANVLAAQAAPTANAADVLFQLRLDAVRRPEGAAEGEEVTEKLVTLRAVVCDLCSAQYGQVPACVNACPHDAALRVNARFEFPVR
jgi:Fe-S-cluster-containing hydrogenase component 2/CRP-like cAMP-binding protein